MKKIALGQMNIEYGNFAKNCETALRFIEMSVKSNCNLILLPELWSSGFDLKHSADHCKNNIDLIQQLQSIADSSNITICGSLLLEDSQKYYNSFIAIRPEQSIFRYYKKHLFTPMNEDRYLTPGNSSDHFLSILGKTSAAICYDLRFPNHFFHPSKESAEVFLLPAHWPDIRINHWDILLQARAIENQAYMIAVNSAGYSGKTKNGGHSAVISPDGQTMFRASTNEEGVFFVDIDTDLVRKTRENFIICR